MKIKEIAFTCYPVADMARARDFYENIIGLKSESVMGNGGGNWTDSIRVIVGRILHLK
jgi:catechol 2,3-dioxygenase-like lactoylglutathione lyase family enzyme